MKNWMLFMDEALLSNMPREMPGEAENNIKKPQESLNEERIADILPVEQPKDT